MANNNTASYKATWLSVILFFTRVSTVKSFINDHLKRQMTYMYLIKLNFGIKSVVGYMFIEQLLTVESQNIFGTFVKGISRILPEIKKSMKLQYYLFDDNVISNGYTV